MRKKWIFYVLYIVLFVIIVYVFNIKLSGNNNSVNDSVVSVDSLSNQKSIAKDDEIKSKIEILQQIINCPKNYHPKSKLDGEIQEYSVPVLDIKRYSCNIDFENEEFGENLEKEIRYWVNYVLLKKTDAHVIKVSCFCPQQKLSFKTGYFSFTGTWADDNNASTEDEKYKLEIGW